MVWRNKEGEIFLNKYGKIAKDFWTAIPHHFSNVSTDAFSIMPNHIHGILIIERDAVAVGNAYMRSLQNRTKMTLSKVVQQYKASVTREINAAQKEFCFEWQKSFYDHVLRNEKSLDNLRQYIRYNHLKWEFDIENRGNIGVPHLKVCRDYYKQMIEGDSGR